jgi:membrane protein implicated in regulation of membrane protease activity
VIVELVTGTFFLLMLGIAAFGAAAAAYFGFSFGTQSIVAAVVAGIGCYGVYAYRAKNRAQQMPPIDSGMPASFESWLDAGARLARVRYRGASWDARVEGVESLEPGATVYVLAADGNTLRVAKNRPV